MEDSFAAMLRAMLQQNQGGGPGIGSGRPPGGTAGAMDVGGNRGQYEDGSPIPAAPSPGLGAGGIPGYRGVPGMAPGSPDRRMNIGGPYPPAPSPGLGSGIPNSTLYEDNSMGYPGGQGDPLLILLQLLLNNRFPNGM